VKDKQQWKSRKLSDADIKGILYHLKDEGVRQRELAEIYGVTQAYVSRLANGKTKRSSVGHGL
jgi:predicted XRE-type DNA-binding protein